MMDQGGVGMQRGRGSMGGARPFNRPFGRGMGGTYGGRGGRPTNMMHMYDSGLSFVMLMILVAAVRIRPTQPSTICGMRNKYQPKCGDALRLRSKGRMAHSICGYMPA